MIVYPVDWDKDYSLYDASECVYDFNPEEFSEILGNVLGDNKITNLAYSGGVDSTIMLCLMSKIFSEIFTYTVSFDCNHPDIQFARQGSKLYQSEHTEFIVNPTHKDSDKFDGDNAVRQIFECLKGSVDSIVCCDGIDELMCGYFKHQDTPKESYYYFLSRLLPDHLIPLNFNSGDIKVYLPFLDYRIINICRNIPLKDKVDRVNRKKTIKKVADFLQIPECFYERRKYGFCDAFKIK